MRRKFIRNGSNEHFVSVFNSTLNIKVFARNVQWDLYLMCCFTNFRLFLVMRARPWNKIKQIHYTSWIVCRSSVCKSIPLEFSINGVVWDWNFVNINALNSLWIWWNSAWADIAELLTVKFSFFRVINRFVILTISTDFHYHISCSIVRWRTQFLHKLINWKMPFTIWEDNNNNNIKKCIQPITINRFLIIMLYIFRFVGFCSETRWISWQMV